MGMKIGIYEHHRGGLYRVLGVASNSTNGAPDGERLVVYVSLTTGKMLVREQKQFNELVAKGTDTCQRFKLITEDT